MTGERGSATAWVLVGCAMLLVLTGFAVDLWEVASVRRHATGLADTAAAAAATAVDTAAYRADPTAPPRLDPRRAEVRACEVLAAAGVICGRDADVRATPTAVDVVVRRWSSFVVLEIVGGEPFVVTGSARAAPVRGGR